MKKRITALLVSALILGTLMTSCKFYIKPGSSDDITPDIPGISDTDSAAAPDNDTSTPEQNTEEKEETPEIPENADDTVLATLENGCEILSDIDGSKYYLFMKQTDELYFYGIIDIDGNIVVEPTYTLLGWCPEHEVIYAEPFAEGDSPVVLDENYKIDLHYGHGGWGEYQYLYDKASEKFFRYYMNFDEVTVEEISEIEPLVPYTVYDKTEPMKNGSYYAFTDPLYDILAELSSDALYEFVTDKGGTAEIGRYSYVSNFKNDYIHVRRDWKYGYIDGLGRESCEIIYEACGGNAYDSKAWVKKDGVWQVIKLK